MASSIHPRRASVLWNRTSPLFDGKLQIQRSSSASASLPTLHRLASPARYAVRVLAPAAAPGDEEEEDILRVEIAGEDFTPLVLLSAEVSQRDFEELKSQQALRVDFHEFAAHVVTLLRRASTDELILALRPETSAEMCSLDVLERTSFRDLTHLSLKLESAREAQVNYYLWERLRQETKRSESAAARVDATRKELQDRVEEHQAYKETVERSKEEIAAARRILEAERSETAEAVARRRAEALREARLEITEEERSKLQRTELRVSELEMMLKTQAEEIARAKEAVARAEAESLRNAGAADALSGLRAETVELRSRVREYETRAFEESSRSARLLEQLAGFERELAAKDEVVRRAETALAAERATTGRFQALLDEAKAERNQQESQAKAAREESKQLRSETDKLKEELEALKSRVATKNVVLREQERTVSETQAALAKARDEKSDLERELSSARTRIHELNLKIDADREALEKSAQLLEKNQSVIGFLNRELNNVQVSAGRAWEGFHTFRVGTE